jgi:hypothetical protein
MNYLKDKLRHHLLADFPAIVTQRLVNTKYRGSQILPHAYQAQKGF